MPYKQSESQKLVTEDVMGKFKRGTLKSSSGDKVKSRKQAVAIALSESGSSKDATPAENKENLKRSLKKKREDDKKYH